MSSKEMMEGLNSVKDILIKPFYSSEEDEKRLKFVIEMKDNFLEGSDLCKTTKEKNQIKEFMGSCYVVTELIYKATKDGFSASSFHSKVDGKGGVIVLIKSKSNQVFGAFTKMGFDSSNTYKNDKEAFLFHVTKGQKCTQKATAVNQVYGGTSYHATFGGGHDLHICDNSNTVNGSYRNMPYDYDCPEGHAYNSTEAKNYFAGSYNFLNDEIEVFKLVV